MSTDERTIEHRPDSGFGDAIASAQSLCGLWRELCRHHLPVMPKDSTWRFSRASTADDPEQGWKLHISANLLTACEVMRRVAPFLQAGEVLFKAPRSLQDLSRINSGLHHGYSQVGKFITVYPRSDEEAVLLARRLHKLTFGLSAPTVPFDLQFRPGSSVYYRYGGFAPLETKNPDGTSTRAIRNPEGDLIPDLCEDGTAMPDWVSDPFVDKQSRRRTKTVDSPLKTTFRVFRALRQRGKGGVYQAIDLSARPPRLCILKEGRKGGEITWDGRDGNWRVRNEELVLRRLQAVGLGVPRVYSSFEVEGNYYVVTEFIEGETLLSSLGKRQRRLTIPHVLRYGVELSLIISRIHAAGWVWRDCKPSNLIVTKEGKLRPLDFEGACPVSRPDPLAWNTMEFSPPECQETYPLQSRIPEDMYALGATLYFLLTGRLPTVSGPTPVSQLRRNMPSEVGKIILELLAPDPQERPEAQAMARRLRASL
ncbi:MAG: hypothetical protein L0229_08365 [Blastocatellia bacterium]|nr:hypothetical protein [Blastocatellia bacterium]